MANYLQENLSIQISVGKMDVVIGGEGLQPLSALTDDCHVHGQFEIRIGDRVVPYMGFFGPDDVCFSDWFNELEGVLEAFEGKSVASYMYDEGEQGQPAFLFEREEEQVFLSIMDSQISEGKADTEWQRVAFAFEDFRGEVKKAKVSFLKELEMAAPTEFKAWVAGFLE